MTPYWWMMNDPLLMDEWPFHYGKFKVGTSNRQNRKMFHKVPKKRTHNSQGNNTWWTFLKMWDQLKSYTSFHGLSLSVTAIKEALKGSLYFKCFFVVFSSIPFSSNHYHFTLLHLHSLVWACKCHKLWTPHPHSKTWWHKCKLSIVGPIVALDQRMFN